MKSCRQRRLLGFQRLKGRKLKIGDTPGQRFSGLFEQVEGSRTQQQIQPGPPSGTAALVNEAAQRGKQAGDAMHLVENDQFVLVVG
jgi:hypothetical protein